MQARIRLGDHMNTFVRCLALSSLVAVMSGCGHQDPQQALIGSWGVDVTAVEDAGASLNGEMAKRMYAKRLEAMRAIRLTFGAGGEFECVGFPPFTGGTYSVDQVEGRAAKVTIVDRSQPPMTFAVELLSADQMSMTSDDKVLSFNLLRR